MIRLNLGCGNYPKRDWLNCDKLGGYQGWEHKNFDDPINEFDLTHFPYQFPNDYVDLITISHCLNQIEISFIPRITKELYRILKPGGIIRITDDDVESATSPVFKLPHFHALWNTGPKIMAQFLREAGFRTAALSRDQTFSPDKSILYATT